MTDEQPKNFRDLPDRLLQAPESATPDEVRLLALMAIARNDLLKQCIEHRDGSVVSVLWMFKGAEIDTCVITLPSATDAELMQHSAEFSARWLQVLGLLAADAQRAEEVDDD